MYKFNFSPVKFGIFAALLPIVTTHLCFIISASQGIFEACLPYWIDCTSISKAGRHGLAYFVFKGGMIPATVLLFIYWQLNRLWLRMLTLIDYKSLFWLALVGSCALLIYSLALGHSGDNFRLLRRFGVVLFMFCSFVSQVKVGYALQHSEVLTGKGRQLLIFSGFILFVAIISLILDIWLGATYDRLENAFEWWLMLFLNLHVLFVVRLWHRSRFSLSSTINTANT